MSVKIPYVNMKQIFDQFVDSIFSGESKMLHGWEKTEFMDIFSQEIVAESEEETYDIAMEAPSTLQ